MRLDFLLAEKLAHRALNQMGETIVSGPRSMLAGMARQQSCRPQLVRMTVLLGLVARQRHQPGLGLRRDHRLLARSRPVVECCQRAVRHRPLDAALDRLMMHTKFLPDREKRRVLAIGEQHRRPRYPARRLGPRPRKSHQCFNLLAGNRQLDRSPPSCHDTAPRLINHKRGIRQQIIRSMIDFMESVV